MVLRAIDLCGGGGGWACAARGLPIQVVAMVDMWEAACRTYALNHPGVEVICGDVRKPAVRKRLSAASGPSPDLILGAIPCEWLTPRRNPSFNPVTDEERDRERLTLRAVLQVVEDLAPRWWCLEDVVGLAAELPDHVPWVEIDSARYSPQRRKRLYAGDFPSPILGRDDRVMRDALRPGPYRIGRRGADRRIVHARSFAAANVYGACPARKSPTVCALGSRRDSELVIVQEHIAGGRRQLEWQEAACLQGFPADYVFYGSPTDVWRMIGQAIQIDTGRAILKQIVAAAEHERPTREEVQPCPTR